jgi:aspartate-semialdehyde dehydrogenase
MPDTYRIAIVGAASLRGKELNEVLGESSFGSSNFVLMDDESALGQLESVGDEVTFVQRIEASSFDHIDFVFFCGDDEVTLKHWKASVRAGASLVDLSYALENEKGVLVRAPWIREEMNESAPAATPDLKTPAIVPAHPVTVALALVMLRVAKLGAVRGAWATVLEPASEYGRAAMDELHQQTVSLLSFQNLPKAIYDAQLAFNLLTSLGEEAKVNLGVTEARIRRHYALLSGGKLPAVEVQLVHAPVFHGQSFSLALEFEQEWTAEQVEQALAGEHIEVTQGDADPPSNLSSAGQEDVLVRVRSADSLDRPTRRFWLWCAQDNLKIGALNAVACATELRRLRPLGKVQ